MLTVVLSWVVDVCYVEGEKMKIFMWEPKMRFNKFEKKVPAALDL